MLFLSCTANFIVHVFPSNFTSLWSDAEVSHKHYLAVSLALATGSMQLQQFQESVGSQRSLGWLPVLSSNMRGLTLLHRGVPDLQGLLSFPHAHSSQTAHTLQATRQHAAGSGTAEWGNGGGRFRCLPAVASLAQQNTDAQFYSIGYTREWAGIDIW